MIFKTMKTTKKEIVGGVAAKVATTAAGKAKEATGWKRWLWGIGAAVAAAIAWFCSGEQQVQPEVEVPAAEASHD